MEKISLVPLCEENRAAYLALEVREDQRSFIETPAGSLADRDNRSWDVDWTILCICTGGQVAGYAMHGMNRYGDAWLDRFMIDRRFQGRGVGSGILPMILEEMKETYPARRRIVLSVEPENTPAIRLYQRFGFAMTGETDCGEAVMALRED